MSNQTKTYPWGDHRRFNSYANYFKKTFGGRVQKLSIDAGFTCPNRDGTVGRGGCTYCNNDSFNPSYCTPQKSVSQQLSEGMEFHARRYRNADMFLAYFQAYSNTYSTLDKLKALYNEALSHPKVIGLVIGTRPDCVDAEKLDWLAEVAEKHYLAIEYGIESCFDRTLNRINRCHDFDCSKRAVEETAKRGIKTGAHFMFGLPGESLDDMLSEAAILSKLPLHTVKFHQLQIIKGTRMAKEYIASPNDFHQFTVDGYINFLCEFSEQLRPDLVIERIVGEVPPRFLAEPAWCLLRNDQLLARYEKRMEERDTWQGKRYSE